MTGNISSTSTRIIVSLGSINMAKTVMLFQSSGTQLQEIRPKDPNGTEDIPVIGDSKSILVVEEEPVPSDSDSDCESDLSEDAPPASTQLAVHVNSMKENSRPSTPLFVPFNDKQEATTPPRSAATPIGSVKLSLLGNKRSPLQEKTIMNTPESARTLIDAPATPLPLNKGAKLAERDLIVGMGSMDTFTEDIGAHLTTESRTFY
jgi:hypothetical protein